MTVLRNPPSAPEQAASQPTAEQLWLAAAGLVDMLATTNLTLDQQHYVNSLRRIVTSGLATPAAAPAAPAHVAPPARPEVDLGVLRELRSFLPEESFRELASQFEGNVRRLRDDLVIAVDQKNAKAVEFATHAMIGAVGAFGVQKLAMESRRAVTAVRESRIEEGIEIAGRIIPQIEPALGAVRAAILEVLAVRS